MPSLPKASDLPSASAVVHATAGELGGFKKFILRGNVVDLAVGVVVGAAFGNVVQAVVKDLITPLLGLVGGGPNLSDWKVTLLGSTLLIGDFLNAVISFVLIAAVVYFLVVLPVNTLMDHYHPAQQPAPTKECPECLSKIPQAARRCRECGAQLAPPSEEVARVLAERLAGER